MASSERIPLTLRNLVPLVLCGVVLGVIMILIGRALGLHGGVRVLLVVVVVAIGVPLLARLPIIARPSEPAGGPEGP